MVDVREELIWRHRCGNNACIEVADDQHHENHQVLVRDSNDPAGPWLAFAPQAWRSFIGAVNEDRI
jgi:hypothetical protein